MFEHWMDADLQKLPQVKQLGAVFSQDSQANKIGVNVTDGGESVTLTGTIRAWIVKPDGTTITQDGSKSGNQAWVVLPEAAYTAVGHIGVFLKLLNGSDAITLGGVEGYVYKSR